MIICGHGLSRRTFELVISKYCWVRVEQLTKSRIWFVSKFRLWIFFKKKTLQYIKLASDVITGLSLVVLYSPPSLYLSAGFAGCKDPKPTDL